MYGCCASGDGAEQTDLPAVEPSTRGSGWLWTKFVYSSTLSAADTARTRIERTFDPDQVRDLKEHATADLTIGGPTLAASALRAGLVDEVHQFLAPVAVGGGTAALPDGLRMDLDLLDERRFASGFVYLRYAVSPES